MIKQLVFSTLLSVVAASAQTTLTSTATQRYFNGVRRNLEASADAMPADKYSFRLTPAQMTFAEWLIHSAQRNYADCAALKGEPAPKSAQDLAPLKDKAAVSQALKDSFTYCAATLQSLNDAKVLATPQLTYSFLHTIVHNNEIYGNIVGYMRASGIVPPSTASRGGGRPNR
ncbi:MAG: DinB family protein [Acidobacteriota bacterium]|nr:DinB family protein [Acidobacteriota bacterium]